MLHVIILCIGYAAAIEWDLIEDERPRKESKVYEVGKKKDWLAVKIAPCDTSDITTRIIMINELSQEMGRLDLSKDKISIFCKDINFDDIERFSTETSLQCLNDEYVLFFKYGKR